MLNKPDMSEHLQGDTAVFPGTRRRNRFGNIRGQSIRVCVRSLEVCHSAIVVLGDDSINRSSNGGKLDFKAGVT